MDSESGVQKWRSEKGMGSWGDYLGGRYTLPF
jgi:hypothetical protein